MVLDDEYGRRRAEPHSLGHSQDVFLFNYDYYISEIDNCPGYEVATPGLWGLHFSVVGTPGYTENQTKWQNELPIASKVVSRI